MGPPGLKTLLSHAEQRQGVMPSTLVAVSSRLPQESQPVVAGCGFASDASVLPPGSLISAGLTVGYLRSGWGRPTRLIPPGFGINEGIEVIGAGFTPPPGFGIAEPDDMVNRAVAWVSAFGSVNGPFPNPLAFPVAILCVCQR